MKFAFLLPVFFTFLFSGQLDKRTVTRKNISHIVLETRDDHYRITLLVSNRFPYNYKSQSYPLFMKFSDEQAVHQMAQKLDKYLETGKILTLILDGSRIQNILFEE